MPHTKSLGVQQCYKKKFAKKMNVCHKDTFCIEKQDFPKFFLKKNDKIMKMCLSQLKKNTSNVIKPRLLI
jgi:UDP-2,3-diacylglucosamine pyrophosphatase LpxH